jgi:hypothetical protein
MFGTRLVHRSIEYGTHKFLFSRRVCTAFVWKSIRKPSFQCGIFAGNLWVQFEMVAKCHVASPEKTVHFAKVQMVGSLCLCAFYEKSTPRNAPIALVLVADCVQIVRECIDVSQRFDGSSNVDYWFCR